MSCGVCKSLRLPPPSQDGNREVISTGTKETLSASAKTCVSCSILWEAVERFSNTHGHMHSIWTLRRRLQLEISYQVIADEAGNSSMWTRVIELYVTNAGTVPEWPALDSAKDIPMDVSSERNLVELKNALEKCVKEHESCPTRIDSPLPTRVIDVSREPIRLWESCNAKGSYVALSHCWGTYQPLRTLKLNLEDHKSEIPVDKLPKTFKDAIRVTRFIGIDYLWIDSLCIIQDSDDDWQRESASMTDVYGNSYVALLATASRDGRGGLFGPDGQGMRVTINRTLSEGREIVVHARSSLQHKAYVNFNLDPGSPDLPLLERSWCFQEYVLSPRIAHFTREEILWQCGNSQGCNCGSMLRMPGGRESLKGQIQDLTFGRPGQVERPYCGTDKRAHMIWWNLVRAYTGKLLTFDGDKLPALSGVAKYMHQQCPDDVYLAGMWKSNLADELFWRTMPVVMLKNEELSKIPAHRPKEYRAPSWSWASVNAIIAHGGKKNWTPDRSKILESVCQPAGLDPTGCVRSGHLLVEGLLTKAESWFDEYDEINKLKLSSSAAQALPELVWQPDVPSEANNDPSNPSIVHLLWWTFDSQDEARALVLKSTEQSGTFQRLGLLEADEAYSDETYDWDEVQEYLETVASVRVTIV